MNNARSCLALPRLKQAAFTMALGLGAQTAMAATAAYTSGNLPGDNVTVPLVIASDLTNGNISIAPGKVGATQGQLSLRQDWMDALDVARINITSAPESVVTKDQDGYYTAVNLRQNSGNALLMDDSTHAIEGIAVLTQGVSFTARKAVNVSSGGSLTIQDLSINLNDHQVYANVVGANGVGAQNKVALWSFSNTDAVLTKATTPIDFCSGFTPSPEKGYATCIVSGYNPMGGLIANNISLNNAELYLTQQGLSVLTQSLGILPPTSGAYAQAGKLAFGTLAASVDFYGVPGYFPSSVPEPATFALMGLGLIGMFGASRRRLHQH